MPPIANIDHKNMKITYSLEYEKIDIRDPIKTTLYAYDICDEVRDAFHKIINPSKIHLIDGDRSGCQAKIQFENGYTVCFETPKDKKDKRKLAFLLYGLAVKKGCPADIFYKDKEDIYTVSIKHRKDRKSERLQRRYDEFLK